MLGVAVVPQPMPRTLTATTFLFCRIITRSFGIQLDTPFSSPPWVNFVVNVKSGLQTPIPSCLTSVSLATHSEHSYGFDGFSCRARET